MDTQAVGATEYGRERTQWPVKTRPPHKERKENMFWIGVLCGTGVGGIIVFLLTLWTLKAVTREKSETSQRLFDYWEISTINQQAQVEVLREIADKIK